MKLNHALAASAFFAAAAAASAQDTPPAGRSFGDGNLPEFLQPYDVDGDGRLSAEERDAARRARDERHQDALDRWDTNGDGTLSADELEAARQATRTRIDDIRAQRFDEANTDTSDDTETEKYLSPAEFAAMCQHANLPQEVIDRIFDHLDTDNDNRISKTEFLRSFQPPPPLPEIPTFETADADSSGDVTLDEFKTACAAVNIDATRATEIFNRHDRDHDGKLVVGEYPGTQQRLVLPPFGQADANGNGFVEKPEFDTVATAAGIPQPEIDRMFQCADRNRDGKLGPVEYFTLIPPPPLPAFAVADANQDGFVGPIEFEQAATSVGYPLEIARERFRAADGFGPGNRPGGNPEGNRDGKLNPQEYASLNSPPPPHE